MTAVILGYFVGIQALVKLILSTASVPSKLVIGSSQLNIKSCSEKTILCVLTKKFNFPIQMITLLIS